MTFKTTLQLLSALPADLPPRHISGDGNAADLAISALCEDSRKADEKALFVAIVGARSDGHDYLAAAYERDISLCDFLAAMLVSYETTIRIGAAIMDYYDYAHSSGTFGAIGVAAGVGRIYGFTKEEMNNVLSVAEFNAPLVPGIRSVEYPSMNKDGVPFGVMVGALAVMETLCGFEGIELTPLVYFISAILNAYLVFVFTV
jgi:hypothetical protein